MCSPSGSHFCRALSVGASGAGAANVARLVLGLQRLGGLEGRIEPAIYNSAPALVLYLGDRLEGVVSVEVIDGKITNSYVMRNPDKLAGVTIARRVSR